ncbi:redoxin family protein [Bacteroidota bacterium]
MKNIEFQKVKTFNYILSLIVIVIILFNFISCNISNKEAQKASTIAFKPNPQRIEKQEIKTLEIGEKAADFNLPDVSGKFYSLNDFNESDVLVILFTCNHCPTAQAYEDRIIEFVNDYKDKSVSVVGIMPNSEYSLLLEECAYSDMDDTYESMKIRVKDKQYNFPYLYDGDNHAASIKYGPTATPHVFVFNKNRELTYRGRIDNSEKPGTTNAEDLRAAVDATLKGVLIENPENKVFGCSIKWAWKTDWTDKVNNDWNEKPVNLEEIDKNGIAELLQNNSDKLRLINIWATWCGPCVIEYPELVKINRMYYNRDFEFISISADNIENRDKVLKFLESQNSAISNYIFNGSDKYELIEAVDPEWDGSLPYSLLIEPGGNKIYKIAGTVNLLELKRKIVENPLLGRYY